jgi:hypothetical protein
MISYTLTVVYFSIMKEKTGFLPAAWDFRK